MGKVCRCKQVANVFPLPVCAIPTTSHPDSTKGRASEALSAVILSPLTKSSAFRRKRSTTLYGFGLTSLSENRTHFTSHQPTLSHLRLNWQRCRDSAFAKCFNNIRRKDSQLLECKKVWLQTACVACVHLNQPHNCFTLLELGDWRWPQCQQLESTGSFHTFSCQPWMWK